MLAPTVILLFVFFIAPVGIAVYQSFFSWDLLTAPRPVGAANYIALVKSGELLRVTGRTLFFSALVVTGAMSLGLSLALLLNRRGVWFSFVRSAVFSAYVVSWVAVALLWLWILDPDRGIVARGLHLAGVGTVKLLNHPDTVLPVLAAVTVWKITGYAMIMFLTGLQMIPNEVLEAARLDGAGAWSRFRFIIWPMLRPTATFVGTTSLVISFQAFDVVRVMTQGGPAKASTLFVYAIYESVFMNLRVGTASALTVVFFAVLLSLSWLQIKAWRQKA
jgi:sn-glycerol 3-phosphate transport system permease protein